MIFDNLPFHEKGEAYQVRYGNLSDSSFYYFDYDARSYDVNMKFQHFHPFYEIYVFLSDNVTHIIDGNYYELGLYDIVCLRPGILHKTFYPIGPSSKRLVIQFFQNYDAEYLQAEYLKVLSIFDNFLPIYRFDQDTQANLMSILLQIILQNMENNSIKALTTHRYFMEFLSILYDQQSKNKYHNTITGNDMEIKIHAICAYIHSHYKEPLSLEFFSKKFFVSPSHLSRQFHKITEFKLTEYIQRTRIRSAQQKLVFTNDKITDIAEECGFSSFSQFNRVFRSLSESSPSECRKKRITNFSL